MEVSKKMGNAKNQLGPSNIERFDSVFDIILGSPNNQSLRAWLILKEDVFPFTWEENHGKPTYLGLPFVTSWGFWSKQNAVLPLQEPLQEDVKQPDLWMVNLEAVNQFKHWLKPCNLFFAEKRDFHSFISCLENPKPAVFFIGKASLLVKLGTFNSLKIKQTDKKGLEI